jgi:hypothetical protein
MALAPHASEAALASTRAVAECLETGDPETSAATVPAAARCLRRERTAGAVHLEALRALAPPPWLAARHAALLAIATDSSAAIERFAVALEQNRAAIDRQRATMPVFAWWAEGGSPSAGAVRAAWADTSEERWEQWQRELEPLANEMLRCFEGGTRPVQIECTWSRLERIFRVQSLDTVVLAHDSDAPPFVPAAH